MAIEYDLDIGTSISAAQAAGQLADSGQQLGLLSSSAAELVGEGSVTVHGTWIRVADIVPRRLGGTVRDALGFTPTVGVVFRYDKFRDFAPQDEDMVRLTVALLDRVPGDAVLHWQYESIWLVRRDGELSLNEASDIWPPDRLALVPPPYRRATYAFE